MTKKFDTELEIWEDFYSNIRCVYDDNNRIFYVEVWRFNDKASIYLPCLIDNIQTVLIKK